MSDKVTPELVEKVARALHCAAWGGEFVQDAWDEEESKWLRLAQAALDATPLVKMREALEATKETLTLLNDRFEVHMGKRSAEIDILLTEIDAALSSNLEGG